MSDEEEYLAGLAELDRLHASGQEDSREFEAICDRLDPLWYRLSPDALDRIRKPVQEHPS